MRIFSCRLYREDKKCWKFLFFFWPSISELWFFFIFIFIFVVAVIFICYTLQMIYIEKYKTILTFIIKDVYRAQHSHIGYEYQHYMLCNMFYIYSIFSIHLWYNAVYGCGKYISQKSKSDKNCWFNSIFIFDCFRLRVNHLTK